jgi:hypothetical protein
LSQKTLKQLVDEGVSFPEYADWWDMGQTFSRFMSEAIVAQWSEVHESGDLEVVQNYASEYLSIVYDRAARTSLVEDFVHRTFSSPLQSGEFDALSYSFFRSAFERMESQPGAYAYSLERERRLFTKRVGKTFFGQVHNHLDLDLPAGLDDEQDFARLKECIQQVGAFLKAEGYLRDHFDFLFTLDVEHAGRRITQTDSHFLSNLNDKGIAYALYEMGYPVILPSAVYLYNATGEAQHHSSRTIEELFDLMGYEARETDDFDPTGFPADLVVELWEIRKLA